MWYKHFYHLYLQGDSFILEPIVEDISIREQPYIFPIDKPFYNCMFSINVHEYFIYFDPDKRVLNIVYEVDRVLKVCSGNLDNVVMQFSGRWYRLSRNIGRRLEVYPFFVVEKEGEKTIFNIATLKRMQVYSFHLMPTYLFYTESNVWYSNKYIYEKAYLCTDDCIYDYNFKKVFQSPHSPLLDTLGGYCIYGDYIPHIFKLANISRNSISMKEEELSGCYFEDKDFVMHISEHTYFSFSHKRFIIDVESITKQRLRYRKDTNDWDLWTDPFDGMPDAYWNID